MATRQQLEQQLVAAHRSGNVQAAQQAAYAIRSYDQSALSAQVPSVNAPPPIERVPKPTFGDYFEDISRGMGRGFVTQLEGMQQLVTHPYDTGKALIQAGVEAVRNPAQAIGEAWSGIKSQAQTAMSSPEGFGRVLGENLDFIPGPGGKRRPTMAELDVYHGTPHTFDPEEGAPLGRFRSSKIGTGEGAQAYGYGLYLAENEKVAGGYRIAPGNTQYTIDGKNALDAAANDETLNRPVRYLQDFSYDVNKGNIKSAMDAAIDDGRPEVAKQIQDLFNAGRIKPAPPGRLYKVDLPDAKIEQMLDWDKPLSEQPKAVRNAFNEAFSNPEIVDDELMGWYLDNPNPTGKALYSQLMTSDRFTGNGQKEASRVLNELGVPGIKYFDEGSRNTSGKWIAKHPKGGENVFNSENELNAFINRNPEYSAIKPKQTRNFVVFPGEEQNLTILERN